MSDACETAETVAEILLSLDEAPDEVGKMIRYVSGDMDDPDDMTYEDWIRPLKLTGGRVCLRFDWEGVTWYVSRAGSGRLMAADELHDPHPAAATSEALHDPEVDVTPVLRDDTPFAEVEDDE